MSLPSIPCAVWRSMGNRGFSEKIARTRWLAGRAFRSMQEYAIGLGGDLKCMSLCKSYSRNHR